MHFVEFLYNSNTHTINFRNIKMEYSYNLNNVDICNMFWMWGINNSNNTVDYVTVIQIPDIKIWFTCCYHHPLNSLCPPPSLTSLPPQDRGVINENASTVLNSYQQLTTKDIKQNNRLDGVLYEK